MSTESTPFSCGAHRGGDTPGASTPNKPNGPHLPVPFGVLDTSNLQLRARLQGLSTSSEPQPSRSPAPSVPQSGGSTPSFPASVRELELETGAGRSGRPAAAMPPPPLPLDIITYNKPAAAPSEPSTPLAARSLDAQLQRATYSTATPASSRRATPPVPRKLEAEAAEPDAEGAPVFSFAKLEASTPSGPPPASPAPENSTIAPFFFSFGTPSATPPVGRTEPRAAQPESPAPRRLLDCEQRLFAARASTADEGLVRPQDLQKGDLMHTMHYVRLSAADPTAPPRAVQHTWAPQLQCRATWEIRQLRHRLAHISIPFKDQAGMRPGGSTTGKDRRKKVKAAFLRAVKDGVKVDGVGTFRFLLQTESQMGDRHAREGTFVLSEVDGACGLPAGCFRGPLVPADVLAHVYSLAAFAGVEPNKRNARVGMLFSASVPVAVVREEDVFVEDDLRSPTGLVATDGCGLIAADLFDEAARHLKRWGLANRDGGPGGECGCYLQARLGGVKGMLVRCEGLPPRTLLVRPSMVKFTGSRERTLYAVAFDRPPAVTELNGQLIAALEARGVPAETFVDCQETEIERALRCLSEPDAAVKYLWALARRQRAARGLAHRLLEAMLGRPVAEGDLEQQRPPPAAGFVPFDPATGEGDAWLRARLLDLVKSRLKALARRIPPPDENCLWLKMVPEPLFCSKDGPGPAPRLQPGQVYVHTSGSSGPLEGPVLLARNPLYEPGNVVLAEAVDVPEWTVRGLYRNALVCNVVDGTPIATRLSSGDYDGDDVIVIKSHALVGPVGRSERPVPDPAEFAPSADALRNAKAATREALEAAARGLQGGAALAAFHRAACERAVEWDAVGLLDWYQRREAGSSEEGILNNAARQYGAWATASIDARKSGAYLVHPEKLRGGYRAQLPASCYEGEPDEDCLQPHGARDRLAVEVLKRLRAAALPKQSGPAPSAVPLDGDVLAVPGSDLYMEFARKLRVEYNSRMAGILEETADEEEDDERDFRGVAVRRANDGRKRSERVAALGEELWTRCEEKAWRHVQSTDPEGIEPQLLAMAAALYRAAYEAAAAAGLATGERLSFPWTLAAPRLCALKRAAVESRRAAPAPAASGSSSSLARPVAAA